MAWTPRHERFAQALADGMPAGEAYVWAGFKESRPNASRLQHADNCRQRVAQILAAREFVNAKATERAIERLAITKERVIGELAKIGFSDIRKLVKWQGELVREEDNPDGGEVLIIKHIVTNHVQIVDSDTIDDDTAGAIAEVSQTQHGLKVKMYDKKAALVDIGKHLGMFTEKHEHTGPGGTPLIPETKPVREVAKLILSIFANAQQGTDAPDSTDV